jgi:hypothetical protein
MPTLIQRHRQPRALLGLALSLYVLALPQLATAASTTAPSNQFDAANGQPLPEVTVIGKMDKHTLNRVINQFIDSHAEPSPVISQIGRWREELCPKVTGLQDPYRDFVSNGIIKLAKSVGAPTRLNPAKCNANIDVVFTPDPQALLDGITQKYRSLLGYYPIADIKQATSFTHPIQAWYVTGSRTLNGFLPLKMGAGHGPPSVGCCGEAGPPQPPSAIQPFVVGMQIDSVETAGTSGEGMGPTGTAGSRLSHGLRSEFVHVLIIVDAKTVAKYPLQTISDYVALLALTHIASLDNCSQLPSILNVFGKDCAAPPVAFTASDAAYLKSLYGADLDTNLNIEKGDLRQRMLDVISQTK